MNTFDSAKTIQELQAILPSLLYFLERPLASYSTVKIGGPAELLIETKSSDELATVVHYAQQAHIPFIILGWGANTLISDDGTRGITIINKSNRLKIISETLPQNPTSLQISSRWSEVQKADTDFFSYYTGNEPRVLVEFESGTPLPFAINQTLSQNLTGLEWFSRIPATIGGAIYNNIHGGTHFLSDQVFSVSILTEKGERQELLANQLDFAYDYSRFHKTKEVIVSAQLLLYKGNIKEARAAAVAWAQNKQQQPQNSLGCVFQNLSHAQQQQLGLPTSSVGYFIDKQLHLSGFQIGGAQISKRHAAFIENIGYATAQNYLDVIHHIQLTAQKLFGVYLKPEIFFRGFSSDVLREIIVE